MEAVESSVRHAERNWGWTLAYGVLLVVIGVFALMDPLATGFAVGIILSISFLFSGVAAFIAAFRDAGWRAKTVDVLFGLLSLLAAFICFFNPFGGAVSLIWVIGVLFLVMGGYELVAGFRAVHDKGWLILLGVVDLLLGFWAVFFMPADAALVALTALVGMAFIVRGVMLGMLAFKLRGMAKA